MSAHTTLTEANGRELAIQMLREIEDAGLDECTIDQGCRDGEAQNNIALRYIDSLGDNKQLRIGFASMITEFVASYADGQSNSIVEFYQNMTRPAN
jgi:hypothetical protein